MKQGAAARIFPRDPEGGFSSPLCPRRQKTGIFFVFVKPQVVETAEAREK